MTHLCALPARAPLGLLPTFPVRASRGRGESGRRGEPPPLGTSFLQTTPGTGREVLGPSWHAPTPGRSSGTAKQKRAIPNPIPKDGARGAPLLSEEEPRLVRGFSRPRLGVRQTPPPSLRASPRAHEPPPQAGGDIPRREHVCGLAPRGSHRGPNSSPSLHPLSKPARQTAGAEVPTP